jgi:hypothetical protein
MTRRLAVPLPDVVLDMLRSEAGRTDTTPNRLAAEIIREGLPGWIYRRLTEALRPVVDAESDEGLDAVPPPVAGPGAAVAGVLDMAAGLIVPPGVVEDEAPGDARQP